MPTDAANSCLHCGLPVPASRLRGGTGGGDGARFCCLGCRLVHDLGAAASDGSDTGKPNTLLLRLGLSIFLTMNIMAFSGFFYSQHVYDSAAIAADAHYNTLAGLLAWLLLLLCTSVIVIIGAPLATRLRFSVNANLLILIGVAAAYLVSLISTFRGQGPLYYDTAAMVLVLLALGGYLDSRAKQKATGDADALLAAAPSRASVVRGDEVVELELTEVQAGDRVRVRPGEAIPVDGCVAMGESHIVEAMLTGESLPRPVRQGDRVLAGAISLDGQIFVTAEATGDDRVVAQIRHLLHEARLQQPAIQRLADRVAAVFVPAVIVIALAVFAIRAGLGQSEAGLFSALSVLLISCPCALGLAAPLATWTAMARAAQRGILFFSAATLERAAKARVVLLDKTGTLTRHEMELVDIATTNDITADEALRLAAAVESASSHPIARALVRAAGERKLAMPTISDARALPGIGVEATIDDRHCRVGSDRLVEHSDSAIAIGGPTSPLLVADSQLPTVYLVAGNKVTARFTLAEQLRDDAADAIAQLRQQHARLCVLTGDQRGPAARLSKQLGVRVVPRLLPADKLRRVSGWQRRSRSPVVFVGDGINDAPALAAADVGIAVGAATDLARHAGHVHLIGDRISLVPLALAIARDAMRRIRLNLLWAFGYNVIGITLAALGMLNPIFAASSMVVSSLLIVMTSRRAGSLEDDARSKPDGESASRRGVPRPVFPPDGSQSLPIGLGKRTHPLT